MGLLLLLLFQLSMIFTVHLMSILPSSCVWPSFCPVSAFSPEHVAGSVVESAEPGSSSDLP